MRGAVDKIHHRGADSRAAIGESVRESPSASVRLHAAQQQVDRCQSHLQCLETAEDIACELTASLRPDAGGQTNCYTGGQALAKRLRIGQEEFVRSGRAAVFRKEQCPDRLAFARLREETRRHFANLSREALEIALAEA